MFSIRGLFTHTTAITALLEGLLMCVICFNFSWIFGIVIVLGLIIVSPINLVLRVLKPQPQQSYQKPKTVFITGGARGIGLSLAMNYIHCGAETIIITDVKEDILAVAAQDLQKYHSILVSTKTGSPCSQLTVVTKCLDVTDRQSMTDAMVDLDNQYHIDVVVANAGVSAHHFKHLTYEEMCRITTEVNVNGVMNTVFPLKNAFRKRRSGQFILISSILSIEPIGVVAYPASKSWVKAFGRGLRQELSSENVSVVTFLPGWVSTQILSNLPTDMNFFMMVPPEVMSKKIIQAAQQDASIAISPISFGFVVMAASTVIGPKLFDFLGWKREKEDAADRDIDTWTPVMQVKEKIPLSSSNIQ